MSTLMTSTEDTEITLGTGKMLVLFFGLVALCAVFFGMGFKLGKNSVATATVVDGATGATAISSQARPPAVKPGPDPNSNRSADVAFYKSSQPTSTASQPAPDNSAASSAPGSSTSNGENSTPADATAAPPANGYYVQVAAVTKPEDGDALVDALKKKQYPAFSSAGADKLFHIEVGPFGDIKTAEDMRSKLVGDGYNPILKK